MATPVEWLREAEEDLDAARSLLARPAPKHACFFAQQAAEKALKSVLLHRIANIPKTHDLEDLLARVRAAAPSFADHLSAARALTKYYFLIRYPDTRPPGWRSPTTSEGQEACRHAEEIVENARDLIAPIQP